jgi:hypothetical protein
MYISLMLVLAFITPMFSQTVIDSEEQVPVENLILKKGNIPADVLKAADELFKGNTQVKWGSFPYELKDYGWIVNEDFKGPINNYEIYMKAANGSDVYAVFKPTGELVRYKTIDKNTPLPKAVQKAIANTQYKSWNIVGDTEVIKDNQNKVVEHYAVKLANGNRTKRLYFTPDGRRLTNT